MENWTIKKIHKNSKRKSLGQALFTASVVHQNHQTNGIENHIFQLNKLSGGGQCICKIPMHCPIYYKNSSNCVPLHTEKEKVENKNKDKSKKKHNSEYSLT